MTHEYCPGYPGQYADLVANYPDQTVYPGASFRTEWGPIFHRGRLDGTARILIIGQDPAAHESFVRRILVGEAGQRVQGFLAKLGLDRSYVMVNASLYSEYNSSATQGVETSTTIAAYRNQWINTILKGNPIAAVVQLGTQAADAWSKWKSSVGHVPPPATVVKIDHPTADAHPTSTTTAQLLANWNIGLTHLAGKVTPEIPGTPATPVPYGTTFAAGDLIQIPERDLPPGLPSWMRDLDPWAVRDGRTGLVVTVPASAIPT
jgi:uracil-DNA glycosylase